VCVCVCVCVCACVCVCVCVRACVFVCAPQSSRNLPCRMDSAIMVLHAKPLPISLCIAG
jgi:hypothetical protein